MSIGFRKGLFGFNCDDVINYINKTHKNFVEKEKALDTKITALTSDLENSRIMLQTLEQEKAEMQAKIDEFDAKYEEIEKLSENIGKLYLVAQSGAKSIIENSENSAKISSEEVAKNLTTIEQAHISLKELRERIIATSESFTREVDLLISSLADTRLQVEENFQTAEGSRKQFKEVYTSITK